MWVKAGSVARHCLFADDGVYRVIRVLGELVEVEVVRAPGLMSGMRFRVTQAAVGRMALVGEPILEA